MKHFLVLLFVVCAGLASAQVPTGTFDYAAATFSNSPLWDVTGTYDLSGSSNGISLTATVVLTNSPAGAITGAQTEIVDDGTVTLDVESMLTGRMSTRAGVAVASFRWSSGIVTGSTTGVASGKATVSIDDSNLTAYFVGSEKLNVKVGAHKRKTYSDSYDTSKPLPDGETGEWTLTIISTNVDTVEGLGIITLYDDLALTNALSGSYNSTKGEARLKLTGKGANTGVSLSLTTTNGAAMDLATLRGKVLGQKPTVP